MKAYIAVSYQSRKTLSEAIAEIKATLSQHGIEPWVFVDKYDFKKEQEKEMMRQAIHDIDESTFLIAETTEKGIGIGIEVGYAKAKGKVIIYVRSIVAEHSTTVSGISDFQIVYADITDLRLKLVNTLQQIDFSGNSQRLNSQKNY